MRQLRWLKASQEAWESLLLLPDLQSAQLLGQLLLRTELR